MSYIVYPRLSPMCNRTVYFVVEESVDVKRLGIYELYEQSVYANFDKKLSGRQAIALTLQSK